MVVHQFIFPVDKICVEIFFNGVGQRLPLFCEGIFVKIFCLKRADEQLVIPERLNVAGTVSARRPGAVRANRVHPRLRVAVSKETERIGVVSDRSLNRPFDNWEKLSYERCVV